MERFRVEESAGGLSDEEKECMVRSTSSAAQSHEREKGETLMGEMKKGGNEEHGEEGGRRKNEKGR